MADPSDAKEMPIGDKQEQPHSSSSTETINSESACIDTSESKVKVKEEECEKEDKIAEGEPITHSPPEDLATNDGGLRRRKRKNTSESSGPVAAANLSTPVKEDVTAATTETGTEVKKENVETEDEISTDKKNEISESSTEVADVEGKVTRKGREVGEMRDFSYQSYKPRNVDLSKEPEGGHSYYVASWIFLRAISALFVVAFVSLWIEIHGLIGSEGISPVDDLYERLRTGITESANFFTHPSVFWLSTADWFLHAVCAAGTLSASLMFFDICPSICAAVSWFLYLSISVSGQSFTDMPWDHLLLETAFLCIFLAPPHLSIRPFSKSPMESTPPKAIIYLFRLFLFRVNLSRGLAELLGKDRTWRTLTAFRYHFETQGSPTPLAYYLHTYAPVFVHQGLVFAVLTVELGCVFMMFGPRLLRRSSALYIAALQVFYILTGNFGPYHWIMAALCILLLDDRMFPSVYAYLKRVRDRGARTMRAKARKELAERKQPATRKAATSNTGTDGIWRRRITILAAVLLLLLSTVPLSAMTQGQVMAPEPLMKVYRAVYPFKIVNLYGPFNRVLRERHELVVEGSKDAHRWNPYMMRYKPDEELTRAPQWVSPFVSRLEFRLWVASTNDYQHEVWMSRLLHRLLEGAPSVRRMFREEPFPDESPEFVRCIRRVYHFAAPGSAAAERGEWWETEYSDIFTPSFSQSVNQMSQRRTELRRKVSRVKANPGAF